LYDAFVRTLVNLSPHTFSNPHAVHTIDFQFCAPDVFLSSNMRLVKNTIVLLVLLLIIACRKESYTTDAAARLSVSADTLHFDTVFTTTGSVTQTLKIFNTNPESIRIASIRLAGGAASPFKINVNGTAGPVLENLELAAGDSAYVFVTVTIKPTSATTPFVVQDSIAIAYNGNTKQVQLQAYGQNAHFLRHHTISGTEVWKADLPYVLLDTLTVAAGAHLTIKEGCRIYAHADAPFVVSGQLTVQGNKWDSTRVVFTGDRLDAPYRDLPGTWPGLIFTPSSHDNSLHYAILKNAVQAIAVEPSPLPNKLELHETIIDQAYDAGILATNAVISAQNILVSNCGRNIVLQNGGTYNFEHATVAGFSTSYLPHKQPVLSISNRAENNQGNDLNAVFRNCIFWGVSGGVVPEEVVLQQAGSGMFQVQFDGVLWPLANVPDAAIVTVPPVTADPEFDSIDAENGFYDFHLKETSPARNRGVASNVSLDLDGRSRPVSAPDLGAYEEQ
jgi:hypothetical protein